MVEFDLNPNLKFFNLPNNKFELILKIVNKIIVPKLNIKLLYFSKKKTSR